ncbi:putative Protein kinase [Melia azedarach]|uniref:Uncharacterized protein n=1 Tax=Melia azedarach TaxID=155640 RepID=A0ACC1XY90_MELAZ|nr:putative Protein kinase [Melia azedarach]
MVMEENNESCGSRASDTSSTSSPPRQSRQQRQKLEVYNEVLRRLKESDNQEANQPGFDDQLWTHFNRLPTRYALDVNVERAEDVLMHKRLLHLAHDPNNRPAIEVRLVQVHPISDRNSADSVLPDSSSDVAAQRSSRQSMHPPPAFGSSPNLEALAIEANNSHDLDGDSSVHANAQFSRPMHEITFSTDDKPKLLSQHAFSTVDGYSLDVFVVDGWPYEETDQLRIALEKEVLKIEKLGWPSYRSSPTSEPEETGMKSHPEHVEIPNDGTDVWEIDPKHLKFGNKVASGSYGDLYKGTYCSQDVAIKVLKSERINSDMQKEFAQEVFIMRKVRHKNVVQFIGACTKPPSLCIVTEFMSGGSVYDYLHKQKGVFKLPSLLKAANLLMDENEVVKVADFGVARVKAQSGVMTAETGTYRWMAPELQAAVGVVQKGLRPTMPKNTQPKLADLLERCWQQDPALRPDFFRDNRDSEANCQGGW